MVFSIIIALKKYTAAGYRHEQRERVLQDNIIIWADV